MNINDIQKAISSESLDGWLFFNFLHRDPLSDKILGIANGRMNSRAWYYMVPASGDPLKICHAVEPDTLEELPGYTEIYSSRTRLIQILSRFTGNWGAQFSRELTTVSTLDYGTAMMLEDAGLSLRSSAGLIQRLCGLLDSDNIATHEEAAGHLYQIVELVWARISAFFRNGRGGQLTEKEVQSWILDEFTSRGMVTAHLPVVASGVNSGNPHYAAENHDNPVLKDSILQLDLWAKLTAPGAIFADISWLGYTGKKPPPEAVEMFHAVRDARDFCADFISDRLKSGKSVTGAEADEETRGVLIGRGYEQLIKHRTGHGIDTEVHGSGAGLDSIEFPDKRPLLDGSCFSIEPGLYSKKLGMRTEIDGYIMKGKFHISGPGPQKEILIIE
ncbi:MAG: aminopeptidase P family protein [Spirochaetales bacterium]|nr:aminopeptidase P family protein [Spirochaetales bacterium]